MAKKPGGRTRSTPDSYRVLGRAALKERKNPTKKGGAEEGNVISKRPSSRRGAGENALSALPNTGQAFKGPYETGVRKGGGKKAPFSFHQNIKVTDEN